jgi:hypothetical protein
MITLTEHQAADRLCDLACTLERKGALSEAKDAYLKAIAAEETHYRSHFLLSQLLVRWASCSRRGRKRCGRMRSRPALPVTRTTSRS